MNDTNELCTDTYEEHIACSFESKVVYIYDSFSKPERKYWDEDAIYKFISEMFEKVKYCKEIMKKSTLKKNLSWVKKMNSILEKLINVIYVINYILKKNLSNLGCI